MLVVLAWTAIACALVALTPARPSTATGALRLASDPPPAPATMRAVLAGLLVVGVAAWASAVVALTHTWDNLGPSGGSRGAGDRVSAVPRAL